MAPWNGVVGVAEAAETKRVEARRTDRAGNKEERGKGRGLLRGRRWRAVLETKKREAVGLPLVFKNVIRALFAPFSPGGRRVGDEGGSLPLTLTLSRRERG